MSEIVVRNAPQAGRYELVEDDVVIGITDYREQAGVLVFPHTVIEPDRRGQGLGEILVRGALDDVRRRGRQIVPRCWFVSDVVDDHPEYHDLLAH